MKKKKILIPRPSLLSMYSNIERLGWPWDKAMVINEMQASNFQALAIAVYYTILYYVVACSLLVGCGRNTSSGFPLHQWDTVPQERMRDPELDVSKAGSHSPLDHLGASFLTAKGSLVLQKFIYGARYD